MQQSQSVVAEGEPGDSASTWKWHKAKHESFQFTRLQMESIVAFDSNQEYKDAKSRINPTPPPKHARPKHTPSTPQSPSTTSNKQQATTSTSTPNARTTRSNEQQQPPESPARSPAPLVRHHDPGHSRERHSAPRRIGARVHVSQQHHLPILNRRLDGAHIAPAKLLGLPGARPHRLRLSRLEVLLEQHAQRLRPVGFDVAAPDEFEEGADGRVADVRDVIWVEEPPGLMVDFGEVEAQHVVDPDAEITVFVLGPVCHTEPRHREV